LKGSSQDTEIRTASEATYHRLRARLNEFREKGSTVSEQCAEAKEDTKAE
jgi:hypothetical protein